MTKALQQSWKLIWIFAFILGFTIPITSSSHKAEAQSPEERCTASGGSWGVQGVEGGQPNYGCECPDRQLNGECISSQGFDCELSGGGTFSNAGQCVCPQGERLNRDNQCSKNAINSSSSCEVDDSFLGIPTWYRGLDIDEDTCEFIISTNSFDEVDDSKNPITIIIINIIAIVTRLAGIIAVIFVVVGGFKYVLSDGDPQKTAEARKTIMNALIGALIVSLAAVIIDTIHAVLT